MKTKNKRGSPRGVRLNSPQTVRRLLSRLVNQTISGKVSVDLLRGVTYSCGMILKSLEVGDLSDKLDKLEERLML